MNGIQINIDADNVMITKVLDEDHIIIIGRQMGDVKKLIWEGPMRETGKLLIMATKLIEIANGEVRHD